MSIKITMTDGLPIDPKANPDCSLCKGYGTVEYSVFAAPVFIKCPECFKEGQEAFQDLQNLGV